jgi:predicted lipid-binding transport protein (Tim44 family)
MLRHWMRRVGSAKLIALACIGLLTSSALMETAEARFGRSGGGFSRSFGSRGSRTFGGGQSRQMQPIQRNRQNQDQVAGANSRANRPSWLQRNPLLGGLMGAIAGTVLGAMLINAFGGMGGFGGILMLFLLGMALFAVFRMFRNRQPQAVAGGFGTGRNPAPTGRDYTAPVSTPTRREYSSGGSHWGSDDDDSGGTATAVNSQTREQGLAAIALEDPKMNSERLQDTLTNRFFQIQEAWSEGDRVKLNLAVAQQMYDEFIGDLDAMERRNERNVIKNIVMRSFEITEAWQEGDVEYATAHINARLIDYTERNGQVIEGDPTNPVQFSEFWTFVRSRGRGDWKLTAINQEA